MVTAATARVAEGSAASTGVVRAARSAASSPKPAWATNRAASSAEHPQVGDGEVNGEASGIVSAVAPTHSSTQRADSHLSRWAPLNLVTAAFFWGERLPCWALARS
eukprot:scaffold90599_cov53-Phaeocystis_antarctica.AAC.1